MTKAYAVPFLFRGRFHLILLSRTSTAERVRNEAGVREYCPDSLPFFPALSVNTLPLDERIATFFFSPSSGHECGLAHQMLIFIPFFLFPASS